MTGITLHTVGTPNGVKVSILLEELKAVGAIPSYEVKAISFKDNEQKSEAFLKINPNGRIPAIQDVRANGTTINVWESASILLYLSKHYDTAHNFHFEDDDTETEMLNWIFFIQGGVGPMQGQLNHFNRYAPEKIPYAVNRYMQETKRLYHVYEEHLAGGREYLVGEGKGKYSLADICTFPWIRIHDWSGVSMDEFPLVSAWLERIKARPTVKLGLNVPASDELAVKLTPAELEKRAKEASAWIMEGLKKEADALAAKVKK